MLIDESEVILKHHKLPALPVKNTVDKILDDYVEMKSLGKANDVRYHLSLPMISIAVKNSILLLLDYV